jgi:hypothetical protein
MEENMIELAIKYEDALLRAAELREQIIQFIVRANDKFKHDEDLRRNELKKVQRGFYKVAFAYWFTKKGIGSDNGMRALLLKAEETLNKSSFMKGLPPQRTWDEQDQYNSLRVRWKELLKTAGVSRIDSRGGWNG